MTVGIVSTGIYLPQQKMTSQEIAALSNIPEDIIRQKWASMKSQSLISLIIQCKWVSGQHRRRFKRQI